MPLEMPEWPCHIGNLYEGKGYAKMPQRSGRPLKIGLMIPVFEEDGGNTPRWNEIKALAQHAEAAGFDSLWVPDHLIYDYG